MDFVALSIFKIANHVSLILLNIETGNLTYGWYVAAPIYISDKERIKTVN